MQECLLLVSVFNYEKVGLSRLMGEKTRFSLLKQKTKEIQIKYGDGKLIKLIMYH